MGGVQARSKLGRYVFLSEEIVEGVYRRGMVRRNKEFMSSLVDHPGGPP